jgi:23S rRNA (adenine2503-C2)-methyltransferase
MAEISIYNERELEGLRSRNAVQPHSMKRFKNGWFKRGLSAGETLDLLVDPARAAFASALTFSELELAERCDSKVDGATKLAFRTRDGYLIESVILRHSTGRTSCCISSQVGCACGCSFCATGQMGFIRNLSAFEMLDQLQQANQLLGQEGGDRIRNLVFMGMGEPLLNMENLFLAVDALLDPSRYDFSGSRIMISTVGLPDAMLRFAVRYPTVNLALSLHSARQEVREHLMPMGRTFRLEHLREALEKLAGLSGRVMIEYLLLAGLTDRDEDLEALGHYLAGLDVHLNLIPYNSFDEGVLTGTQRIERERFAKALKQRGFKVTLRSSLGADIAAACGQLVKPPAKGN